MKNKALISLLQLQVQKLPVSRTQSEECPIAFTESFASLRTSVMTQLLLHLVTIFKFNT